MMLASDDANTQFVGATNPDAALAVEFYTRPVQHMFKSSKEGRPIFEDVIYVKIQIPGMKESIIDTPARSDHRSRFPLQWAHYENRTKGDAREIGTPLAEWPVLTRSQAEEFRALRFFTVEAIANASDQNINNLGMMGGMSPYTLREKARAFIKAATDTSLPQLQAEELAKRDTEIAMLKQQIAEIAAIQRGGVKPDVTPVAPTAPEAPKRKRGRPSKAELEARKAQGA